MILWGAVFRLNASRIKQKRDAKDFAGFAETKLSMPMLVLAGERASGEFLIEQDRLVADHVEAS